MGVLNEPVVSWIAFSADHFVNEPRKPDFLWLPKPGVGIPRQKNIILAVAGESQRATGWSQGKHGMGMKQPDLGSTKIR